MIDWLIDLNDSLVAWFVNWFSDRLIFWFTDGWLIYWISEVLIRWSIDLLIYPLSIDWLIHWFTVTSWLIDQFTKNMINHYLDLVMSLSLKPFFNMPCQVTLFSSSKFFCSQINLEKQEVKIRISASSSREQTVIFICFSFVVFAITRHHLKTFFDNFL